MGLGCGYKYFDEKSTILTIKKEISMRTQTNNDPTIPETSDAATATQTRQATGYTRPEGLLDILGLHGVEHVVSPGISNKLTGAVDVLGRGALVYAGYKGANWLLGRFFGSELNAAEANVGGVLPE